MTTFNIILFFASLVLHVLIFFQYVKISLYSNSKSEEYVRLNTTLLTHQSDQYEKYVTITTYQ
jgi:hypothetical protein